MFISECAHLLKCSHAEYADDITLWYSHTCPRTLRAMINDDLRTIETWARRMRLQFGDKNEYFVFHQQSTTAIDIEKVGGLQFYSAQLSQAKDFVLLGVHFDHALLFDIHTEYLVAAAKRRGNMLRCVRAAKLVKNSEAMLVLYKGWVRPKIEYASEIYGTVAKTHALELEKVQALCLRIILGASKTTPHILLQNEASVSSLLSRRRQKCLMTFMKVMSLPQTHVLQATLRQWWRRDIGFEGPLLRPKSFFGFALHSHIALFGCAPPQNLPIQFKNPYSLPPWSSIYTPPKKVDVHLLFRRNLREKIRVMQLAELRESHKAAWYNSIHPISMRRIWMRCLPQGGVYLRVMIRLRTGYTTVGAMLPYLPEQRCPECGAIDSIEHLLFHCIAFFELRSKYFSRVRCLTEETLTLPLLLGFSSGLSNDTLRKITTETARFVIECKRWP